MGNNHVDPIVSDGSRHRVSRRTFVKGATATTGAVVASSYIKPGMRTLGVPGALAQVSGSPDTVQPPGDGHHPGGHHPPPHPPVHQQDHHDDPADNHGGSLVTHNR